LFSAAAIGVAGAGLEVGVEKVVEGEEEGFGVAGEEEVEGDDGEDDAGDECGERGAVIVFEVEIEGDAEEAADAVVDGPDGEEEVAGLAFIGVAAAGAAVERREVVAEGAGFQEGKKDGAGAAFGALESAGAGEIHAGAVGGGFHLGVDWTVGSRRFAE
jgi:hypothetical protein